MAGTIPHDEHAEMIDHIISATLCNGPREAWSRCLGFMSPSSYTEVTEDFWYKYITKIIISALDAPRGVNGIEMSSILECADAVMTALCVIL